ncbi:MAG: DNA recombination protein RmuC [Rhodocyclaceae bacterium]|nr:DNA recombination protein RmuC [Rhodocyclaceae bacterium]
MPLELLLLVLLLVALVILAAAVFWLGTRFQTLAREQEGLPERMTEHLAPMLEARHRAMLGDLHDGLAKQGERLSAQSLDAAERLRRLVAEELHQTREGLSGLRIAVLEQLAAQREDVVSRLTQLASDERFGREALRAEMLEQTIKALSEHGRADRELLQAGLNDASKQLAERIAALTKTVDERLELIGGKVSERLDEGFRKTNETFVSVMSRLATIDEAQKKIESLTTNVVSLQELLGDKRSRGAFGEVQLEALVKNMLPPDAFEFQYVLPNNTRADCVLKLPEPTGLVAVDSKFPLENYQRMFEIGLTEAERRLAQSAFRADVRRHVDDIASKYLIPNVTSDGAVMFVPAEAVFAEIHAYHAEVVSYAQQKRVWIVSPTTLMAILNTARAVMKDVETKKQIHVIKEALGKLAKDFGRFDERMQKLTNHIRQAHEDAQEVHVSSKKISSQFSRIEKVQLEDLGDQTKARLEEGSEEG